MLSPAEVFARADVQALWAQEAASLHSWLANRISEGFYKGPISDAQETPTACWTRAIWTR